MRWSFSQMRPSPGEKNRHSVMSARRGEVCTPSPPDTGSPRPIRVPVRRETSARETRDSGGLDMGMRGSRKTTGAAPDAPVHSVRGGNGAFKTLPG